jgi:hypothetical protein
MWNNVQTGWEDNIHVYARIYYGYYMHRKLYIFGIFSVSFPHSTYFMTLGIKRDKSHREALNNLYL